MALFAEVWSFRGLGGNTWNEVHYSTAASLEAAAAFTPSFIKRRTDLLHPVNVWTKVRITQVTDPAVHTLANINAQGTWPGDEAPANPAEAAVVRLASSTRAGSRFLWLRGIPESGIFWSETTGQSQITPTFRGVITAFINRIGSGTGSYAIKVKKKGIGNGIVKTRILEVDGTPANGTSILTVKDAPLVVAGDYIEITKAEPKLFPGLRGPFKVLAAAGVTITIQYSVPQNEKIKSDKAYSAKLAYWEDATINPAISGFAFGGSRKTKNASIGSRGAKRAQRLRN